MIPAINNFAGGKEKGMKNRIAFLSILLTAAFVFVVISILLNSPVFRILSAVILLLACIFTLKMKHGEKREMNVEQPLTDESQLPHEEKMAYIGTVAAGLAHEIRNPLNAIDFNIRMIQEDFESGDWDQNDITNRFKSTYKEIKHLERLVNDFLLYARKKALQLGKTDVVALLENVKAMLSETAETHKVEIKINSGDVPSIDADGEVLKQALFNIAKNGIESMTEGGILSMGMDFIEDKDAVRVKISDNGIGIQPHDLKKIFHLFYSTRRSGTGLGLPVAKSIIENHNGWIEIESKPGKGTTFDIFLPRKFKEGSEDGK